MEAKDQALRISSRDLWNLIASNFFFVAAYVVLGSNSLFLVHDLSERDRQWIILGMSLFATFQAGGTWFLSFISPSIERSNLFFLVLRLFAIGLLATGNPFCIFLSLALFGLSHSVFYKISRRLMSELIKADSHTFGRGYLFFGFTTNLAFIIFSSVGAVLISRGFHFSAGVIFSAALLVISFFLIKQVPVDDLLKGGPQGKLPEGKGELNPEGLNSAHLTWKEMMMLIADTLRFAAFLLPFSVINAAIAQKVEATGLPSSYNALLIGVNSLVIIGLQLVGLRFRNLFEFSLRKYDLVSLAAVALLVGGFFTNIWLLFPVVILYSLCEAYQLPNIEHLLFTTRSYQNHIVNRFLLMDSIVCFLGPWIGALSINFNYGSPLDLHIKGIVDALANLV